MKLAVLFPGQGSQYVGMGQTFIEADPEAANLLAEAEEITGLPLGKLLAEGPMEELTRNRNLQPAITVTNLLCWQALQKQLPAGAVSCFAGHSLGEYSALFAAGVLSAEDTLRLVARRGSLMEQAGLENPGGMRAVIGLSITEVDEVIAGYAGPGVVTTANHNTPQQVVISGNLEALDSVTEAFESKGAKVLALNVSVANHSPLVAGAVPEFREFMQGIPFSEPQTPVYLNVSADLEHDPQTIKEMMANQIASRVRWCESIEAMLASGVDTFIEVGPKTVLKGMMRKIVAKGVSVTTLQCDTVEGVAACLEKLK